MKTGYLFKSLIFILLNSTFIFAQFDDEMKTERPNKTNSATVIQPWGLQLEAGLRDSERGGTDAIILIRTGIYEDFELRLGWFGARENPNISIGTKIELLDEISWFPQTGLIIDILHSRIGSYYPSEKEKTYVSYLLSCSYSLPFDLSLGFNLGADDFTDTHIFKYSSNIGMSILPGFNGFIEIYGNQNFGFKFAADRDFEHNISYGITYQFYCNNQIDLSIIQGLSDENYNYISMGYSIRFMLE